MIERRVTQSEVEARSRSGRSVIEGYASLFDKPYSVPGYTEVVAPTAFRKTIQESDVRCLVNHDPNIILGRNRSGTLELTSDTHGLHYRCTLPDTQAARDLYISTSRGDVTQSSFAFEPIRDIWAEGTPEDGPTRTLREVRLWDVSPVTYPAAEATTVDVERAARSLAAYLRRPEDEIAAAIAAGDLAPLMRPRGVAERLGRRAPFRIPTF